VPRKAIGTAICAVLAAFGAAPAGALTLAHLRSKIAREARKLGPASGVYVRDLGSGRTLYSRNADRARAPASNEKLLTTSTALLRYGPDATLRTRLVAAAQPVDGVIHGDVALIGAGDPYFSRLGTRSIVQQLVDAGVTEITGRVLGDGSLLDSRIGSYDSGYAYDRDLGGSLGGLVIDEGQGTPALHAASVLRAELHAADITVVGPAKAGSLGADGVELASVLSLPLSKLVTRINVPSDNFAAELLLKDLGASYGGAGSTTAGAAVVRSTLARYGARPATVVDGSGLSRIDHISPRQVVNLLAKMAVEADGVLRYTLPVAGRSGTLSDRMRHTTAAGNCQAKTGTLSDVSALSGYCTVAGGGTIVFSMIENRVCGECVKPVEDHIAEDIARYVPGT
jgi:D-alanyl-D-alanine carboxypeptidase/D-alanyl-D-alanine-endopeptidase (penicillin-binding protein 4)